MKQNEERSEKQRGNGKREDMKLFKKGILSKTKFL